MTSNFPPLAPLSRGVLVLLTLGTLGIAAPASAATLNVPSQYPSISAAITAAAPGDTVLVADGTYTGTANGNMMVTKAITLASVNGAASTIVDLGSSYFMIANAPNITIQGFTFQNSTSSVGAIETEFDDTIEDCVFIHNINSNGAAAIQVGDGTATITRCTFTQNSGSGVIGLNGSNANISDCTFAHNTGSFGGGVIVANTATIHVTGSTFDSNNWGANGGGGVGYLRNGNFTFSHCTFTGNTAGIGGVLFCSAEGINTTCAFDHSLIQGNSAPKGGVINAASSSTGTGYLMSVTAVDSVFIGNTATDDGAVLYMQTPLGVAASFTNDSFYGNKVTGSGVTQGGVLASAGSNTVNFVNSILFSDNTPLAFSLLNSISTKSVSHSDLAQAGFAGANGNINAAPGFIDPTHGDLRISASSPCAFTGISTGAPADDYLGQSWTGGVSMGAYAPLAAASVAISAPSSVTLGAPFSFAVTVKDQFGQPFSGYAGTVHFTSTDGTAVLPADATLTNGTATFSATLNTAGSQTLAATDAAVSTLTGTSGPIVVSPGAAVGFRLTAPASTIAGQPIDVIVSAVDALGHVASGYAGTVHFSSSDTGATLPEDLTLTHGTATVSLTLVTVGSQSLTVHDTVQDQLSATTNVNVTPAAAKTLQLAGPSAILSGTSFSLFITAQDAFGNIATGYAGPVQLTSSDAQATLPADQHWSGGAGSSTVTLKTVGAQTLTVTDSADPTITAQLTVNVTAPDLTLTLAHAGTFTAGQSGTFTIDVKNAGSAPTSSEVKVVDALPVGMSATAISGEGWTCNLASVTCTRSEVLEASESYPQISLTVALAGSASGTLNNVATVSGGGELDTQNDQATDPVAVAAAPEAEKSGCGCGQTGGSADLGLGLGILFILGSLGRRRRVQES